MAANIHSRTSFLIRGARLARLVWHLLQGLASVAFTFPLRDADSRRRRIRRWSAQLLPILGCHLRVTGSAPGFDTRGVLFVSNHISWIEIFAIKAVCPARFVAKSEIRGWPVIGWLCAGVGTIFIERTRRRDVGRVGQVIADALAGGECCAVFPEGAATDGTVLLPFHASLLEPAVLADATVIPVAVRFTHTDGSRCAAAAYDGDTSLWDTVLAMLCEPRFYVDLHFALPLAIAGRSRRELALAAENAIASALSLASPRSGTETACDLRAAAPSTARPTDSPCPMRPDSGA
jgi:1-acyl-sn-glycerol-3-phosphate acyltransferase